MFIFFLQVSHLFRFSITLVAIEFCSAQNQAGLHQNFMINNTEQLKNLLVRCGGTLNPRLVATTLEEAKKFPNLISKNRTVRWSKLKMCQKQSLSPTQQRPTHHTHTHEHIHRHTHKHVHHFKPLLHIHHIYHHHSRKKRSIGTTTVGQCFGAGSLTDTNKIRICTQCMATRDLGEKYYPRYINEVICDQNISNPRCFGGEGGCTQKEQSYTFFQNIGTSNYTTVNINIRVCCECELNEGSLLVGFL